MQQIPSPSQQESTASHSTVADPYLPVLTVAQADELRFLAHAALARKGVNATVDGDRLTVPGGYKPLGNLASICRSRPPEQWPALVERHFNAVSAPDPVDEAPDVLLRHAVLRLIPDDYMPPEVWQSFQYARPLAEGLFESIALDQPDAIRILNDREVERVGLEALRAAGRANLIAEPVEHYVSHRSGGPVVHGLGGESMFVASKALVLGEVHQTLLGTPAPDDGILVAVPSRHHLVFHPIQDSTVVPAINQLMSFALNAYRDPDNPGLMSPRVYWWQAGTLTSITTIDHATKGFSIEPPEQLMAILRRVAQPQHD
jgi:hypothetical protein